MFDPRGAVDYIDRNDPATLDRDALRVGLELSAKLRSYADAAEARFTAAMRRKTSDVAGELTAASGASVRAARCRAKAARALESLPATLGALANGDITSEHAGVVAAAVAANPAIAGDLKAAEAELVSGCGTVEQLTRRLDEFVAEHDHEPETKAIRQHRNRRGSFFDAGDDMVGLSFKLTPVDGALVKNALTAEARRLWQGLGTSAGRFQPSDDTVAASHPQLLADALTQLIRRATTGTTGGTTTGGGDTPRPAPAPSTRGGVGVLALWPIDQVTGALQMRGVATRLSDGTPLAPETIRRLACTHGIINGLVDDNGAILAMGRKVRCATPEQRLVLRAMWGACINCGGDFDWCDMHHIDHWTPTAPGQSPGATDTDRLVPICDTRCHELFHEHRWRLETPAPGVVDIYTPDGALHKRVTANTKPRPQPRPRAETGPTGDNSPSATLQAAAAPEDASDPAIRRTFPTPPIRKAS